MAARGVRSLLAATGALACIAAAAWYVRSSRVAATAASVAPQRAPATAEPGDAVRGLALVNGFRDSLPSRSGNALRCTSCHLDNGTRPTAMPWLGAAAKYPKYRARPGYEEDMARRINECIARSLAGRMLREDGRDMRDMIAYIETLRHRPRAATVDSVLLQGVVDRGRDGYAATCARCHGSQGEGTSLAPAAWGVDSYSIGAGLARQFMLATFVRHNMPHDRALTLTDQQAADIAAFVITQPRQEHPGKERDWPNADPPSDVAYTTLAAQAAGKRQPAPRPLLPRRVVPDSLAGGR